MSDDLKERLQVLGSTEMIGNITAKDAFARIEALEAENFALAAGLCPHHYGDEHGHSQCKMIDELRAKLARSEGEHVTLQICFDRVVKQRDEARKALSEMENVRVSDSFQNAWDRLCAALKST